MSLWQSVCCLKLRNELIGSLAGLKYLLSHTNQAGRVTTTSLLANISWFDKSCTFISRKCDAKCSTNWQTIRRLQRLLSLFCQLNSGCPLLLGIRFLTLLQSRNDQQSNGLKEMEGCVKGVTRFLLKVKKYHFTPSRLLNTSTPWGFNAHLFCELSWDSDSPSPCLLRQCPAEDPGAQQDHGGDQCRCSPGWSFCPSYGKDKRTKRNKKKQTNTVNCHRKHKIASISPLQ